MTALIVVLSTMALVAYWHLAAHLLGAATPSAWTTGGLVMGYGLAVYAWLRVGEASMTPWAWLRRWRRARGLKQCRRGEHAVRVYRVVAVSEEGEAEVLACPVENPLREVLYQRCAERWLANPVAVQVEVSEDLCLTWRAVSLASLLEGR